MTYTLRTRFKNGVIAEFLPPPKTSNKVIIFCGGMPSAPSPKALLEFFSKKGYWVFYPRYRGSWESGGEFLKYSPEYDILEILKELPRGIKDLWDNKIYKIRAKQIYIIGSSFGGAAAILASQSPKVNKAVALSPVIDWRADTKEEPLVWLGKFVKKAFGEAYRFPQKNWLKLKSGKFYNPIYFAKKIDGSKLLIIHAKDDKVVPWKPAVKFSKITGAELVLIKGGGHLSTSSAMQSKFYKKIKKFINSK